MFLLNQPGRWTKIIISKNVHHVLTRITMVARVYDNIVVRQQYTFIRMRNRISTVKMIMYGLIIIIIVTK